MKVKVVLKFRGREMAHTEFGFQLITKFLKEIEPYGHPDAPAKLLGRAINVMISPLPRAKRAKNPHQKTNHADSPHEKHSDHHPNGAPHPTIIPRTEAGGTAAADAA
jgi:translation initiation factor IF-3